MTKSGKSTHTFIIILVCTLTLSCIPAQAFSLRDTRELFKRHRFKILAVTSAAVVYMYTNKLIKKAIQDYNKKKSENGQVEAPKSTQDYCEGFADAFIKVTKLIGTIFKVFRATTCPDEGKTSGDQWLDDFSQLA